jgi:hypothetical protein
MGRCWHPLRAVAVVDIAGVVDEVVTAAKVVRVVVEIVDPVTRATVVVAVLHRHVGHPIPSTPTFVLRPATR